MNTSFTLENIPTIEAANKVSFDTQNNSQTITGAGTIDINFIYAYIVNSGGSYTITLPNGSYVGQKLIISVISSIELIYQNITLSYTDGFENVNQTYLFGNQGDTFECIATNLGWQITPYLYTINAPSVVTNSFTPDDGSYQFILSGTATPQLYPFQAQGCVFSLTSDNSNPILNGTGCSYQLDTSGDTTFTIYISEVNYGQEYSARAFATNYLGVTGYGAVDTATLNPPCLAKGTMITLSDDTVKAIENIDYSDNIKVWNFDKGCFDSTKPLWISNEGSFNRYNIIEFSNGSVLKTLLPDLGHRIFNKEAGKFTYPMTDDTPLGTTTVNDKGEDVKLVSRKIVDEDILYYNIITEYHVNMYANGILTSCRYNNIYPINDMKFIKDITLPVVEKVMYSEIPDKYYTGLRLSEQSIPVDETVTYIKLREKNKKL